MRLGILVVGIALVVGTAGSGLAGTVNCKQVNKYLQTGRSTKDVAETMVISESDVKKCQEEAAAQAAGGGEGKAEEATEGAAEGADE
jgi:hypothetical protein